MSTNCLVKKLKGTVNNDSLKKYGCIRVIGTFNNVRSVFNGQNITKVLSGGLKAYSDENKTTELISPFTNGVFYLDGTGTIEVNNKYELTGVGLIGVNTEDITFCTKINSIENMSGDIKYIPNLDELRRLQGTAVSGYELYGSLDNLPNVESGLISFKGTQTTLLNTKGLEGDIRKFAKYIELTNLNINYDKNVYGNIEDLASDMVSNGRTSGTLYINAVYTNIKYNNTKVSNCYIDFDSSVEGGYSVRLS